MLCSGNISGGAGEVVQRQPGAFKWPLMKTLEALTENDLCSSLQEGGCPMQGIASHAGPEPMLCMQGNPSGFWVKTQQLVAGEQS